MSEAKESTQTPGATEGSDGRSLPRCDNGEPWSLPGHGISYELCGKIGFKGCPELTFATVERHDVKKYRRTCGRAECPVCSQAWSTLEAWAAMERFNAAQKQGVAQIRLLKHVVVSPPSTAHAWSVKKLRKVAYRTLSRTGVKGGVCIFHPFRWRCSTCGLDDESCECETEPARGVWYWSPHFHAVAHGWIDGTAEEFARSGWLVKNLGLRANLYATLKYQLSHAGVWMLGERILPIAKPRGGKTLSITWFGTMSYAKLRVKKERFTETCSTCGRKLVEMEFDAGFDPPFEGMQISGIEAREHLLTARWERYQSI